MDFSAAHAQPHTSSKMSDRSVLAARGIGKTVRSGDSDLVILRDIDLEITSGASVAVVGASAVKPRLRLADEPAGSRDAASGTEVIALLFEMNREYGATLVMVTHDEALAARCARIVRLAGGRIAA